MSESNLTRNDILELKELGKSSSARNETRSVLVEGSRSISGAHRSGAKFRYILTSKDNSSRYDSYECEVISIDESTAKKIATTTNPQTEIAICEMPLFDPEKVSSGDIDKQPVLILDNVNDPGNLGTIIRSSVAFSVGAILLIGGCDPYNPKVVRSSAGTIFGCNIANVEEYQLDGLLRSRSLFRADAGGEISLEEMKLPDNAAIAFGNEANGFTTSYFATKAQPVSITMSESCESLNVAMTATIVAYQLAAQRN